MTQPAPDKIRINHDDYHAEFVGHTSDGRQFFLTNPFVPALGDNPGREFLALYIFDPDGNLLEAKIDDLGMREDKISPPGNKLNLDFTSALIQNCLGELGKVSFCDIIIAPFRVEKFGIEFGLIEDVPEETDEFWFTVEPGNYMAFYPPYDGEYYA
jgi:hypothetical protein